MGEMRSMFFKCSKLFEGTVNSLGLKVLITSMGSSYLTQPFHLLIVVANLLKFIYCDATFLYALTDVLKHR